MMVQVIILIKKVVSPVLKKEKAYLCAIPTKPKTPKEKEQVKKHDLTLVQSSTVQHSSP